MSTIYMSQLSSALPLMEMEGDHHLIHHHHQDHQQAGHFHGFTLPTRDPPILFPFVISNNSSTSDSSSLSYGSDHHLMRQHHPMLDPQHMIGGSSGGVFAAAPFPTVESIRDDMIERSSFDPYDTEKLQISCGSANKVAGGKWGTAPAAKMRITRKTGADPGAGGPVKKPRRRAQAYDDHGYGGMSHTLGVIRVCSDCNTTKTPLWRSGPSGPKSLCNACGIRQRKARRAMMATGVSTGVAKASPAQPSDATTAVATAHPKVKKEKRADVDRSLPFKKRCKVVQDHACVQPAAVTPARDHIDNIEPLISWNKSPTSPATATAFFLPPPAASTFAAQDEITDAAMLLMTLSCGLVRS